MTRNRHELFMRRAVALAGKAEGKTYPNPLVGTVIVKKGEIIGEGYHRKAGLPHAEIAALKKAGRHAQGADLYVNLEPCAHYGKTPPCVDSIIKSGIKKVYVAMRDPNPLVRGRGLNLLKRKGIEVKVGICRGEAKALNASYVKSMKEENVHRHR